MENTNNKKYFWLAATLALLCASFAAIAMGLQNLSLRNHPNGQVASITVTGEGEVTTIPDIATINFTVRKSAKTVPEAQKIAEKKVTQAIKDIGGLGVDKKDTKTISYSVNPKYETQGVYCTSFNCPPVKTVVTGYEVAQTIQVKVRKIDTAGDVVGVIGKANITEINGPDFTVDDMDKPQADAKAIAIKKAQDKAKVTANALGVGLGAIIQFNEEGNNVYPVMYRAEAVSMKVAGGVADSSVTLPQGENVIKKTVSITYELR